MATTTVTTITIQAIAAAAVDIAEETIFVEEAEGTVVVEVVAITIDTKRNRDSHPATIVSRAKTQSPLCTNFAINGGSGSLPLPSSRKLLKKQIAKKVPKKHMNSPFIWRTA